MKACYWGHCANATERWQAQRASATSLGSLFQYLTTPTVMTFFLMSNLILPRCRFVLFCASCYWWAGSKDQHPLGEHFLSWSFKHPMQWSSQLSFQSDLNSLISLLISLRKLFHTIKFHHKIIVRIQRYPINFHQVLRFLRQLTWY